MSGWDVWHFKCGRVSLFTEKNHRNGTESIGWLLCCFFLKQKTPLCHVHTRGVCVTDVGQTRKNWFM